MSEDIERSGRLKDWVDSLPDFTADEMRQTMADISSIKLKSCDITPECPNDVAWIALWHECAQLAVCEIHAQGVMGTVMEAISLGGFSCDKCGQTFNAQASAVRMWRV